MASSHSPIYDPIRKEWVKRTPEELVRQRLLQIMVRDLHFPPNLIAVEKELSSLPHLRLGVKIPKRRVDILAYGKSEGELFPLLMVECKAVKLTTQMANQVVGYNAFVEAPFLTLVNQQEVLTGSFDEEAGHFKFLPGLRSYERLLSALSCQTSRGFC